MPFALIADVESSCPITSDFVIDLVAAAAAITPFRMTQHKRKKERISLSLHQG
jgi:hypothetical protein